VGKDSKWFYLDMLAILRALRLLRPLLRLRWWMLALLILLGLLSAISEGFSISLIIPLLASGAESAQQNTNHWFARLFSRFSGNQRVMMIAACFLAGVVLKNALSYAYGLLARWLNATISHRLRSGILAQVLSLSQLYLDSQESGKLINTLGSETWRMASALSTLGDMLIDLCMVLIFAVLLLSISLKLTLVCGVFFLFVSLVNMLVTRRVKRLGKEAVEANRVFTYRMLEVFNGLRVIRLFGREEFEQDRFDNASLGVRKTFFRVDRLSSIVPALSEVLAAIFFVSLLVTAKKNPAELGATLVFLVLLYRMQTRIKSLDHQRVALEGLAGSVEDVRSLLDSTDKPFLRGGDKRLTSLTPGIRFEDVSLAYDTATDHALKDVTLSIRTAETTALVGSSGAGKSSIASLICRLYDPTSGVVTVGDCDLRDLDLAWWRSRIAVVSQDVHLFNTSVAENISYGKPGAGRKDVLEAAKRAQASQFIEALPQGYETNLGERGLRLSGGQRQRIALARALIRDPEILILDEATNALDLISEHLVQDALEVFAAGRTVIIIAHRISTIENADQVIVLDAGRVLECGKVQDLVASGGYFSRLYALQFKKTPVEVKNSAIPE
jgi:ATP-binding cassette, subfamily B, bacterial MsbA